MPLSIMSRRAHSRRYYTVSSKSRVDESLFGPSHREVDPGMKCYGHRQKDEEEDERLRRLEPRKIKHITKDLIRNLWVPIELNPPPNCLVLKCTEFQRLQNAAHVVTEEEKKAAEDEARHERERILNESNERRQQAKIVDRLRKKNEKLTDLEEEERLKSEILTQKARIQLQENEDEIKKLNEMILEAKCHVVRDAQVVEKKTIGVEIKDEERRLDHEMEVDRVNAIRIEEEIERKRKNERMIGAMMLMDQIQHNAQDRLLDLERKDQENKAMQKYIETLCEEELAQLDKLSQNRFQLKRDLDACLEDTIRQKEMSKEQEKLLLQKVFQFQKEKAEREEAYEKEQRRIRHEKEMETARLRAMQERARDEQAERDALRAKRAQEQTEREWRKKEALEVARKANTEAMLKKARVKQQQEREHFQAIEAQRDRADFERVLRAHQQVIEKKKRECDIDRQKKKDFLVGIQTQIAEKQEERIQQHRAKYAEGIKMAEEARQRRLMLDEVKQRKFNELKSMGIDAKYLSFIDRKITNMKFP